MELLSRHVVEALQLALWLALPTLCASLIAGLTSAVLQAATQVQDPALSFVPRLLAVALALSASAALMQEKLVSLTAALWREIARPLP